MNLRKSLTLVTVSIALGGGVALAAPAAQADQPAFQSQAVDSGLSASEADKLQRTIDTLLAKDGGKQTAANEISYADGRLLVPLPGEKYVRELNGSRAEGTVDTARHTCTSKRLCGYSGRNYTGQEREWYRCNVLYKKPSHWRSGGSWYNNQTPGRQGSWYDYNKRFLSHTRPAPYGANGNWAPVGYAKAC
ncbi:hypothetical protein [Streptomyces sp. NRRL B-1347]|uniref:hypothetical protein n=1 Tax=Streptomyces sp. NRRL B-1347 TaxID=1476877 RepID=UPI00068B334F|nr:hypothetical protein [Streptomyces sp. NRRL B-1347]